jgi:hypothetical protein
MRIIMSVEAKSFGRQAYRKSAAVFVLIFCAAFASSCGGKKEEAPVIPPVTSPLSRSVIGFGVINASYTHVTAEPVDGGISPGYLRRGSLVRVLERRTVKNGASSESWVLVDGTYRGWLRETLVDIYDNEGRALTAAEAMSR